MTSRAWEVDTKARMPTIGWIVPFSWDVARGATLVCGVRTRGKGIQTVRAFSSDHTMVGRVVRAMPRVGWGA
jgi:hypothetical protein